MATNKIALKINYRKNTNMHSASYGKYYPEVDGSETLSLRGLSEHIKNHGSIYTRDIIEGVLIKMSECIPELVAQGIGVKLDGLGKFYPTAKSVRGGVAEADLKGVNSNDIVKGIHIRFLPTVSHSTTSPARSSRRNASWSRHISWRPRRWAKNMSVRRPRLPTGWWRMRHRSTPNHLIP
ncbi:MAG: hypothetical protein IJV17_06080 [Prevotella sp.]|nr:hypothetical protein [Prevotella sp.]